MSPTVFNFYRPEFTPSGPIEDAGLVAPEAQITNAPEVLNYFNSISTLVNDGDYGGGLTFVPTHPSHPRKVVDELDTLLMAGRLSEPSRQWLTSHYEMALRYTRTKEEDWVYDWEPLHMYANFQFSGSKEECSAQCGCLATDPKCRYPGLGGAPYLCRRWDYNGIECMLYTNRLVLPDAQGFYPRNQLAEDGALKLVMKMLAIAPEYHVTNIHSTHTPRKRLAKADAATSKGRDYKAVVVLYLDGGVDSFNVLVPRSNCSVKRSDGSGRMPHDLFSEYANIRGFARGVRLAHKKEVLLPVNLPTDTTQPCTEFGLHPSLPNLKKMYDEGDVAFIANAGALNEPSTKEEYYDKRQRPAKFPPGLFSHNLMKKNAQTVHANDAGAKGVLGRMAKALGQVQDPLKTAMYSINGFVHMLDAVGTRHTVINPFHSGIQQWKEQEELGYHLDNLTQGAASSVFAETYADLVQESTKTAADLGTKLETVTLDGVTAWPVGNYLGDQLRQVAQLMKVDTTRADKTERAAFFTQQNGFDTHEGYDISAHMEEMDSALEAFKGEMKHQNLWDKVTVVMVSDFGRTLASNGRGTDHGWGGHYFVAGGNVKGGDMLGVFPERLDEFASDVNVEGGRMLPTTPWDATWHAVAQWWGITDPNLLNEVLPNAHKFPNTTLFTKEQLFQVAKATR
jgi:cullin-associated NEDD8-dissociated protein 1